MSAIPEEYLTEQKAAWDGLTQKLKGFEQNFDRVDKALDEFKTLQAQMKDEVHGRLDAVEVKVKVPSTTQADPKAEGEKIKAAYVEWARKGEMPPEGKALSVGSDPAGGYTVPTQMSGEVISNLIKYSPMRELARIYTVSQGDSLEILVRNWSPTVSAATETGSRTETATGSPYGKLVLQAHEFYANPGVTQRLLDDSAFDIAADLSAALAEEFSDTVMPYYTSGNGAGQPYGFTIDANIGSVTSEHATLVTVKGLRKVFFELEEPYRRNATWQMNKATMVNVYGLSDGQSRPFLHPDMREGVGFVMWGRPIRENEDLPNEGASAYPIYFGDWREGYAIIDRQGMVQLRDPYSNKPYVHFYTTWRTGGRVRKAEAIKKLQCSA